MPRQPGAIRNLWVGNPLVADLLIALFCGSLIAIRSWIEPVPSVSDTMSRVVGVAVTVYVMVALALFRRNRPLLCLVLVCVAALPLLPAWHGATGVAVAFALYAVALQSARRAWVLLGAVGAIAALALVAGAMIAVDGSGFAQRLGEFGNGFFGLMVMFAAATSLGIDAGNRKRYITALVEHAEQLDRQRQQHTQLAAVAERQRIAREIHDIVAHSLSIMVRLADGADVIMNKDPRRAQDAIQQVGKVGRSSMSEMRRVLGVLRENDDEQPSLDPQPELADLEELIESYRRTGLPITFSSTGSLPTGAGVELTVFRTVQEALTNTLRYAVDPTEVVVCVEAGPSVGGGIRLEITNDSRGPARPSTGSGRGLIGMAERAALYGGVMESGPVPGGGWRISVTLPDVIER